MFEHFYRRVIRCNRGCGGSTTIEAPEPAVVPGAGETAKDVFNAQLEYLPKASDLAYDIAAGPKGIGGFTQLQEQARAAAFPGEEGVRQQLQNNILQQLISPTGATAQQQAARRSLQGEAIGAVQQSARERANLGGRLFSGGAKQDEMTAVGDLVRQFTAAEIGEDEQRRLNTIQAALPFLSILFPGVNIAQPQFTSPVPGANQQLTAQSQTGIANMNAANAAAMQQSTNQASMQSAMWGALGKVGGGIAGAATGKFLGS